MRRVRTFARKASRVTAPVLILGETGTGKSHLGRAIHGSGSRGSRPFLAVNCAGIPDSLFEAEFFGHRKGAFTGAEENRPGLLEQARGGTLFLDELGDLAAHNQAKLLTAIEEGEVRRLGGVGAVRVDLRVMAATSRNVQADLRSGIFRRDLYHRVAVLTCHLPPLRDRPEDIRVLAGHFLRLHRRRHGGDRAGLSRSAMAYLENRSWPGNARELSHLLEAALILAEGRSLDEVALREADRMAVEGGRRNGVRRRFEEEDEPIGGVRYAFPGTEQEERETIRAVLAGARGNKSLAARRLGMARNTLRSKLKKYGLS
jgi:DNA-binding NtrC family response regulator